MKKYIGILIGLNILIAGPALSEDMSFDFNDFTDDGSLITETVDLNSGADVASVGGFDIAGIMLGMSFDDIYGLFFQNKGLYAPRKENSVIYKL